MYYKSVGTIPTAITIKKLLSLIMYYYVFVTNKIVDNYVKGIG